MTYMLTIKDLETRGDDTVYVGPLEDAQNFVRSYCNVSVVSRTNGGLWSVFISEEGEELTPTLENCNEYGNAPTEEEAWRFALGAAFGPANDDFSAFPLTHDKGEALRASITHHFPKRLDVYYNTSGLAVVEDEDGNMWRVWPDGVVEVYRR